MSASPLSLPRLVIDLDAVRENYTLMAKHAPQAHTGAAIKADCYGLGLEKVAPILSGAGCTSFFCATITEALAARKILGGGAEIFVLNGVFEGEAPLMRDAQLTPVLSTPTQITHWREHAAHLPAALHVDTGINRLGLDWREFSPTIAKDLKLSLVMSHLACADSPQNALNNLQLKRFSNFCADFPGIRRSLANSAGALLGADWQFDLTRPGIALYGGMLRADGNPPLRAVAHLHVPILQVRTVKHGDSIGYGADFVAPRDMAVATAAIGYADGLPRAASPDGFGRINGERVPLLGRVSMDMAVFDVSALSTTPKAGDMLSLLGSDLEQLAIAARTLSYELLTGLGPRFVREYKGLGA